MTTRRRFFWLAPPATGLLVLLLACGREEASRPASMSAVRLQVAAARPPVGAPILGPVDTLRFDLRGRGGELLVDPTVVAISPTQTSFSVSLAVPSGADRSLTVMALGTRPVSGTDTPTTGRGILYLGRIDGIDVEAGQVQTLSVTLQPFVPEFLPFQETRTATHTIEWTAVPGADRYILRRFDGKVTQNTSLQATTFTGNVRPMAYQVRAVDFSGVRSAPSDWLVVGAAAPAAPSNATATQLTGQLFDIEIAWTDNSNNEDGFEIQRDGGAAAGWIQVGTVGANVTSFIFVSACESSNTFRVRAFNSAGSSAPSNETNTINIICLGN